MVDDKAQEVAQWSKVSNERTVKKIDELFCPMCENAHKALIPMVSSNHQQVLVYFSGTEWSEVEDTYEQKYEERNEGQMLGLRELQDGARYVMKE